VHFRRALAGKQFCFCKNSSSASLCIHFWTERSDTIFRLRDIQLHPANKSFNFSLLNVHVRLNTSNYPLVPKVSGSQPGSKFLSGKLPGQNYFQMTLRHCLAFALSPSYMYSGVFQELQYMLAEGRQTQTYLMWIFHYSRP
jgi:hypothetical protein